jgi:hypothetical protein
VVNQAGKAMLPLLIRRFRKLVQDLLFLAHRIPFPPNKGDKVRSFNELKHLAKRYRVHLGAFIDEPGDWRYVDELKKLCVETYFAPLHRGAARYWS